MMAHAHAARCAATWPDPMRLAVRPEQQRPGSRHADRGPAPRHLAARAPPAPQHREPSAAKRPHPFPALRPRRRARAIPATTSAARPDPAASPWPDSRATPARWRNAPRWHWPAPGQPQADRPPPRRAARQSLLSALHRHGVPAGPRASAADARPASPAHRAWRASVAPRRAGRGPALLSPRRQHARRARERARPATRL